MSVHHEIEVDMESNAPHLLLRQLSPAELAAANSHVQDWLRKGKTRPSPVRCFAILCQGKKQAVKRCCGLSCFERHYEEEQRTSTAVHWDARYYQGCPILLETGSDDWISSDSGTTWSYLEDCFPYEVRSFGVFRDADGIAQCTRLFPVTNEPYLLRLLCLFSRRVYGLFTDFQQWWAVASPPNWIGFAEEIWMSERREEVSGTDSTLTLLKWRRWKFGHLKQWHLHVQYVLLLWAAIGLISRRDRLITPRNCASSTF